jgi:hypothetical protein
MLHFSAEVEEVLREAGWTPTRHASAVQWVDPLVKVGYTPLLIATQILENLGGLAITPPSSEANVFFPSEIIFDPVYAASSEFDRVKKWQEEYDLLLFPLGEYDPTFILLCSEDGRIFGARERQFDYLGATIADALELRILARHRPISYPKPENSPSLVEPRRPYAC